MKRVIALALRQGGRLSWADRTAAVENLRESLSGEPTVLFLCYGNICRSPFAAEYFESKTPSSVSAVSSGFYPESGRESPPEAVEAASDFGVDLEQHRSSTVTDGFVQTADLILLMDYQNIVDFALRHPRHISEIHLLRGLIASSQIEIKDPYGGTQSTFNMTYEQIADSIDTVVTELELED